MKMKFYKGFALVFLSIFSRCGDNNDNETRSVISNNERFNKNIQVGESLVAENRFDEALTQFNSAVKIDSIRPEGNYGMGIVMQHFALEDSGTVQEAKFFYDKVIEADSNYRRVFYNRSTCKVMLGDYDGALIDINIAFAKNVPDVDYYINRSAIYFHLGNKAKGCDDIRAAISMGAEFDQQDLKSYCN